jgi:hypothetical protein
MLGERSGGFSFLNGKRKKEVQLGSKSSTH